MGTKRDPGDFDCHAKAADDEPLFTLMQQRQNSLHVLLRESRLLGDRLRRMG